MIGVRERVAEHEHECPHRGMLWICEGDDCGPCCGVQSKTRPSRARGFVHWMSVPPISGIRRTGPVRAWPLEAKMGPKTYADSQGVTWTATLVEIVDDKLVGILLKSTSQDGERREVYYSGGDVEQTLREHGLREVTV